MCIGPNKSGRQRSYQGTFYYLRMCLPARMYASVRVREYVCYRLAQLRHLKCNANLHENAISPLLSKLSR